MAHVQPNSYRSYRSTSCAAISLQVTKVIMQPGRLCRLHSNLLARYVHVCMCVLLYVSYLCVSLYGMLYMPKIVFFLYYICFLTIHVIGSKSILLQVNAKFTAVFATIILSYILIFFSFSISLTLPAVQCSITYFSNDVCWFQLDLFLI